MASLSFAITFFGTMMIFALMAGVLFLGATLLVKVQESVGEPHLVASFWGFFLGGAILNAALLWAVVEQGRAA